MQCPNGYTMSVDGVCQPVGAEGGGQGTGRRMGGPIKRKRRR